ncbi:WecB/TagA/CpsF family glycosyltransferase [Hymenobacter glaciei]|uniref:WecB/TagA/CpsF family glycosyltransferase n=1 Tax=Hymenobacter glaciei TaxID=877209 RepID=A0ABP7TPM5_9BACT
MEIVTIGKARINNITQAEAIQQIDRLIARGEQGSVVTPNLDHIVKLEADAEFAECYSNAALVLVDGNPLLWAARLLGTPLRSLVTGSDLFPALCKHAVAKRYRLFFLGGREGVAEKAAVRLAAKHPGLEVVGTYCPPFGFEKDEAENSKIIGLINDVQPHILFVGLGAPKQEKWIDQNLRRLQANVALGIGASFEFEAGTTMRAPQSVRQIRMEWFWRFTTEPRRLFRRYFIDSFSFLPIIWRQWQQQDRIEK